MSGMASQITGNSIIYSTTEENFPHYWSLCKWNIISLSWRHYLEEPYETNTRIQYQDSHLSGFTGIVISCVAFLHLSACVQQ